MITQDDIRICSQNIRERYIRMFIYDKSDNIINELSGKIIEGTIDMDGTANIQRQVSGLKILLDNDSISYLLPNKSDSLIWTNKYFKIEIGIRDLLKSSNDSDYIHWYNQGVFLYKSPEIYYSSTESYLTTDAIDKMCRFTGDLGGSFETDIKIENSGVPITEAVKHIIVDLGGENSNKLLLSNVVDDNNNILSLPYTLTKSVGDTMYDTIKELVDLYKYWIFYYDENGDFVLEHRKMLWNSSVDIDFSNVNYEVNSQIQEDYTYIKNYVKVVGQALEPTVTTVDYATTDNPNPINNSTSVKIIFNKSIYDSNHNKITDGMDLTNYFEYTGTVSNYTKAIYSDAEPSVTFTCIGENAKIIKPKSDMIFDSGEMSFDDGGIIYSSKDTSWSKLLTGIVITDGVNNTIQFELSFNKALFDKNGDVITTGTDLKSSFTYSNGDASNFLSAVYNADGYSWSVKLKFAQAIENAVIQINKDGLTNVNAVYDSSGTIYEPESYIMDGTTWTKVIDTPLPSYQISAYSQNTDDTSPYSINNIGKRVYSINEDTIYNITQAQNRADFELETHSNLNETITISLLPQFYLKPNMIIYLKNDKYNIDGKYRLDKVSCPLKIGESMQLTLVKLYKTQGES